MRIEYTSGCICESLTVDNTETADMSVQSLKHVLSKVINNTNDIPNLQSILINAVEMLGEGENLGHCDECGDNIYKYILET